MVNERDIEQFINTELRPRVNVDGGDIIFCKITGDTVHLTAGSGCADCPGCNEDFIWWLEKMISTKFKKQYKVTLYRKKPYY